VNIDDYVILKSALAGNVRLVTYIAMLLLMDFKYTAAIRFDPNALKSEAKDAPIAPYLGMSKIFAPTFITTPMISTCSPSMR
jgi:hypothetical protein